MSTIGDYATKKLITQMEQFNIDSKSGEKQMTLKSFRLMGEKCGWQKELINDVINSIFQAYTEKGKPCVYTLKGHRHDW